MLLFKITSLAIKHIEILTSDDLFTTSLNCTVSSILVPYLTVLKAGMHFMKETCSSSIYNKLNFLWKLHCSLNLNRKGQN